MQVKLQLSLGKAHSSAYKGSLRLGDDFVVMGMTGAVGFGQRQVLTTLPMHLQKAHTPAFASHILCRDRQDSFCDLTNNTPRHN